MIMKTKKTIKPILLLLFLLTIAINSFAQVPIATSGDNFFVAFGKNSDILTPDSSASTKKKNVELILRINAEVQTTVEFVFRNAPSLNKTFTVSPGITDYKLTLAQSQACYWGKSSQPNHPDLVSNKSLQVLTSAPITLIAMSSANHSVDATAVLPVSRLGTKYIQQGMPPKDNNHSNGFVLIATEDGTAISIAQPATYPYNYPSLMNKGDVFFVNYNGYETRATVIESSKPVAMFHNSSQSTVEGRDNYMFEQMLPVNQWGKEFILPASYNELNGMYAGFVRIYPMGIASVYDVNGMAYFNDNSNSNEAVKIDWPGSYTYRRQDLILNGENHRATACHIKTDKQVSVCAYNIPRTGVLYDQAQPGEAWLPPVDQRIQKVLVSPLDFNGDHVYLQMWHYFLIITPTSSMNNTTIAIDGGSPQPIQDFINQGKFVWMDTNVRGSGYAVGRYYFGTSDPQKTPPIRLQTRALVENSNGMIILAYGQGSYTNYFYAAGYGGRDLLCDSCDAPELKNNADLNVCSGTIIDETSLKSLIIYDDTEDDIEFYLNSACTVPFTPITTNNSTQSHTVFAIFKNKFTGCKTNTTNALGILTTVNDKPTISTIPTLDALCSGTDLLLTTPTVTDNGCVITEQGWQIETNKGSENYTNITLPYEVSRSDNGKKLHYYVDNMCGTSYSNKIPITVDTCYYAVRHRETGDEFKTIREALAAVKGAGYNTFVLEVFADVTETSHVIIGSEDVTIVGADGAHTVTMSSSYKFSLEGGGTLTLGEGLLTDILTISHSVGVTNGTIHVKDGIIIKSGSQALSLDGPNVNGTISGGRMEGPSAALDMKNGAKLSEISGGIFTGATDAVHLSDIGTKIELISGGTFYQKGTYEEIGKLHGHVIFVQNYSEIGEISGGYFEPTANCAMVLIRGGKAGIISNGEFVAKRVGSYANNDRNATIRIENGWESEGFQGTGIDTISGGHFSGAYFGVLAIADYGYSYINYISGGIFEGTVALQSDRGSSIIEISGGKFIGSQGIFNVGKIEKIGGQADINGNGSYGIYNYPGGSTIDEIGDGVAITGKDYGIMNSGTVKLISGGTIIGGWSAINSDGMNKGTLEKIANGVFWGKNDVAIQLAYPLTLEPGLSVVKGLGHYWGKDGVIFNNDDLVDFPGNYRMSTKTEAVAGIQEVEFKYLELPEPIVGSINTPAALCSSNTLMLSTPTVNDNGNAITAQGWQIETSIGSDIFTNITLPYQVSYNDNGKKLRYYATNNCGTTYSNEVTVTVKALSTSDLIIANGATICSGSGTTLTASAPAVTGTPIFKWYNTASSANPLFTGNPFLTGTLNSSNNYFVSVEGDNYCEGTDRKEVFVEVSPSVEPTIMISTANSTVCAGTSVTFNATASNEGTAPIYQWKKNNSNVGANSATYSLIPVNGDVIACELTSNVNCASPTTATSDPITMTIIPTVNPSISISSDAGASVCSGTSVTFTATVTNEGTAPVYQWKKNGSNVGEDSNTYSFIPVDGDVITCELISNAACASPATVTSEPVVMTVTATVAPTITISTATSTVCSGTSVTFTATVTNEGTAPTYQWKKNGINVGTNSDTYNVIPVDGDVITCELISNAACASPATVTSEPVVMTVTATVAPTITISTAASTVCSGTSVTFTATVTNEGTTPSYQWKKNGSNVGSNNNTYNFTPVDGDVITCTLTSNATCAAPATVTSAPVTMTVNASVVPTITISTDATTACSGTSVTFTATVTNEGTVPAYQWKKNGINVGENSNTYSFIPVDGDVITCELTSNAICAAPAPVTSNPVAMVVKPSSEGSSQIDVAGITTICSANTTTLTASATSVTNPVYRWYSEPAGGTPFYTGASYTTSLLTADTTFYVSVSGDNYCEGDVREVKVTIGCFTIQGTVFPFVFYDMPAIDTLFNITAALYAVPRLTSADPFRVIYNSTPLYKTTASLYDGSVHVPGTPKNPGFSGNLNNPGYPINWSLINRQRDPDAVDNTPVLPGEAPSQTTVGLYTFFDVPEGDYLLVLSRPGLLTRYAKITVSAGNLFVEHRELVAGDANNNREIDGQDVTEIYRRMGIGFGDDNYNARYDINSSGDIDISDVSLARGFQGFNVEGYEDTKEWLLEY
jgi:hypothetical protein